MPREPTSMDACAVLGIGLQGLSLSGGSRADLGDERAQTPALPKIFWPRNHFLGFWGFHLVRQDIPKDVAGHHDIKLLRVADELHRSVVHILVSELNLRAQSRAEISGNDSEIAIGV
jgi:hypothetical protein